jgi:hypothetical protein
MNNKQIKTKNAVFSQPIPKNITWDEVVSLLLALGCTMEEHEGSAIVFSKNKVPLFLHSPHPGNTLKIYAVKRVKTFLSRIGVAP